MSTASTSTSALSSLLSALNNGSQGLDVASAVNSILYADRAPERAWQAQQTVLASQTTAIQQLESYSLSVATDLQSLGDPLGTFSSVAATSSDSTAVSATAATGTVTGHHSITVNNLATTGSWYSAEQISSTSALTAASFTINQGGKPTPFTLGSGNNNLTELAASINSAAIGVSASVVTDANGARLALVAQNSGTAGDFTVSSATGIALTQAVTAKDASLTVDGAPITSSSNTVVNAINGLTLNLLTPTTSAATITIAPDTSQIQTALSSFVSDYNSLIDGLNSQFTFNATTQSEGVLGSDSVARSMQSDILAASNLTIGSGSISNLGALGITTNKDGTLSLNTQTLNSALASNYRGVVDFFGGSGSTTGYSQTLITTFNSYTNPSQGAFTVDLQSISNENQDLTKQTATLEAHLAQQQSILTLEYNNANIALQQLPSTIKSTQVLLGTYSTGSNG
jgi:flagellar hook-associated protein 2